MTTARPAATGSRASASRRLVARVRALPSEHTRLVLLVFAVLSLGAGSFALVELRSAAAEARQLYEGLLASVDLIGGLQFDVQEARRRMLYALTTRDANLQVQYADESRAADARVRARILQRLRQLDQRADLAATQRFQRDWAAYLVVRDGVIALILEGQTPAAVALDLRSGTPAFDRARADLLAMQAQYRLDAEQRRNGAEDSADRSLATVIGILVLAQLLAVVGLRMLQRGDMLARERRSQSQLSQVVETIDEGMIVLSRDHRVVLWNAAAERLSGRPRDRALGLPLHDAWPAITATRLVHAIESTAGADRSERFKVRLDSEQGARVFGARTFPFDDGTTVFFSDITDRERQTDDLQRSASLLVATLESTADGILVVDTTSRITLFNQRFLELWRIPEDVILAGEDSSALSFVATQLRDPDAFVRRVREVYALPDAESFDELEFVDGRVFERYSVPQRLGGACVGRVWSFRDTTMRKSAERQLVHDAFHDALTFLPNRSRFSEILSRSLQRARHGGDYAFAMLFLDIDRFKVVNDSLGHAVGDQLLVAVARRLEACVRPGDTVARLGGDEFTVLIDKTESPGDATAAADRIMRALERPFELESQQIFIGASLGIALSATGYAEPHEMMRDADTAMYRAKANGKGRYEVFDTMMHTRAVSLLQLETDLRVAIGREEFRLLYQPIVSLGTGRVVGLEALVRWDHPTRGMVSPDEFLELAEETGLIVPIGQWVLREACAQLSEWRRAGLASDLLSVSVNLSARQVMHPALVEQVVGALEASGLPARTLHLEFTESAFLAHTDAVLATFSRLRALGIHLDLDDFGTGYSSLSYLLRFEIDGLKIDRSFVRNIGDSGERSEIARAIVALAHSLNITVIAEGVETPGQLEVLRGLGCDVVQGFLCAPPLSPGDAGEVLAHGIEATRRDGMLAG